MEVLAVIDIFGMIVLFFALIVIGMTQASIALGTMYGMHKLIPDKLTETTYGTFDFDHFQKPAFEELLLRLTIIFLGTTFVLHFLDYFLVGRYINGRWRLLFVAMLFLSEIGAIAGGLYRMFKLDWMRLGVLTGTSAFFYLLFLWYLVSNKFLF